MWERMLASLAQPRARAGSPKDTPAQDRTLGQRVVPPLEGPSARRSGLEAGTARAHHCPHVALDA